MTYWSRKHGEEKNDITWWACFSKVSSCCLSNWPKYFPWMSLSFLRNMVRSSLKPKGLYLQLNLSKRSRVVWLLCMSSESSVKFSKGIFSFAKTSFSLTFPSLHTTSCNKRHTRENKYDPVMLLMGNNYYFSITQPLVFNEMQKSWSSHGRSSMHMCVYLCYMIKVLSSKLLVFDTNTTLLSYQIELLSE